MKILSNPLDSNSLLNKETIMKKQKIQKCPKTVTGEHCWIEEHHQEEYDHFNYPKNKKNTLQNCQHGGIISTCLLIDICIL